MNAGYEIQPAPNGGFIVTNRTQRPEYMNDIAAAFSNAVDLLGWLADKHKVTAAFGGYTVPPEAMDVVRKMVSESAVTVTVNGEDAPASTGLVEAVRKAVEGRKVRDTGRSVVDDWSPWHGLGVPQTAQRVEVSFRCGEQKTDYVSKFMRWEYPADSTAPYDILAYRVV